MIVVGDLNATGYNRPLRGLQHLGLREANLAPASVKAYAAPRRLALLIRGVPLQQQDRETLRRGPAITAHASY